MTRQARSIKAIRAARRAAGRCADCASFASAYRCPGCAAHNRAAARAAGRQPPRARMPVVKRRLCVICGALVRNQNPKTVTCDPVCTRAKHNGRSRQGQIEYEMAKAEEHEDDHKYNAEDYCGGCQMLRSQCDCWDPVNQT